MYTDWYEYGTVGSGKLSLRQIRRNSRELWAFADCISKPTMYEPMYASIRLPCPCSGVDLDERRGGTAWRRGHWHLQLRCAALASARHAVDSWLMPPRRRSSDGGKPSVAPPRTHSGQYPQYFHIAPNGAREPYPLRATSLLISPLRPW